MPGSERPCTVARRFLALVFTGLIPTCSSRRDASSADWPLGDFGTQISPGRMPFAGIVVFQTCPLWMLCIVSTLFWSHTFDIEAENSTFQIEGKASRCRFLQGY